MTAYVGFLLSLLFFVFLVVLAAIPAFIAFRKKHRNKWLIAVFTALSWILTPLGMVAVIMWLACLCFAMYTPPEQKLIQGPAGPAGPMGPQGYPGENGKDGKDAIPLSKRGFYRNGK